MVTKAYKLTLSLVFASHRIKAPKELKMILGVELVLALDCMLPFQAALHCIVAPLMSLNELRALVDAVNCMVENKKMKRKRKGAGSRCRKIKKERRKVVRHVKKKRKKKKEEKWAAALKKKRKKKKEEKCAEKEERECLVMGSFM